MSIDSGSTTLDNINTRQVNSDEAIRNRNQQNQAEETENGNE